MSSVSDSRPEPATAMMRGRFVDYVELTKPRLSLLSVITALVGYVAARPPLIWSELIALIIGTSMAAGGVAALNQWMEQDTDARMKRTADRPLPAGRVPNGSAFVLGWLLCIAALGVLFVKTNGWAALFTLFTIGSYLGWYTPAKRSSRWSTEIGALAGAFPPMIGWCAADGPPFSILGWILFGILLFWQIPHFMAIAWLYRRDYAAVKFPMLPVRDEAGGTVAVWSLINTIVLLAVTLAPGFLGHASSFYLGATAALGAWFLWRALAFLRAAGRDVSARKLFFASIIWLPLQLGVLVADRLINR